MDSIESRLLVNGHGIRVMSSLTLIKMIMSRISDLYEKTESVKLYKISRVVWRSIGY